MSINAETLVSIHEEARRERLLDMEDRVRRYRLACFGILPLALAGGGGDAGGYLWVPPPGAGLVGFAIADPLMRSSSPPAIWGAGARAAPPAPPLPPAFLTGGGP